MHLTENLIIGGGPAGLAVAGSFTKAHIPYTLVEASQQVAHAWHHHYDRLHLHTVKELSHLPHKPFPADYPQYVPRHLVAEYMDNYAREMQIKPHYGQEVSRVERADQGWRVETLQGTVYQAQRVIVATGFNRRPHQPQWPGMESYQGQLIHSRAYRRGQDFKDKKVLVVGMGNTGAEIAADLAEQGARSALSVRGPVNVILRDPIGRPVQKTAIMLAKLPNWLGDALGKLTARLTVGDLSAYGIETPNMAPAAQLRITGKTPVIDVGTVDLIKSGKIKVFPEIQQFHAQGVTFGNDQSEDFDAVVLATGYKAAIEEFLVDTQGIFDHNGVPKSWQIAEQPDLFFIGYDCYTAGGLLYVIRRDAERLTRMLSNAPAKAVGI